MANRPPPSTGLVPVCGQVHGQGKERELYGLLIEKAMAKYYGIPGEGSIGDAVSESYSRREFENVEVQNGLECLYRDEKGVLRFCTVKDRMGTSGGAGEEQIRIQVKGSSEVKIVSIKSLLEVDTTSKEGQIVAADGTTTTSAASYAGLASGWPHASILALNGGEQPYVPTEPLDTDAVWLDMF